MGVKPATEHLQLRLLRFNFTSFKGSMSHLNTPLFKNHQYLCMCPVEISSSTFHRLLWFVPCPHTWCALKHYYNIY